MGTTFGYSGIAFVPNFLIFLVTFLTWGFGVQGLVSGVSVAFWRDGLVSRFRGAWGSDNCGLSIRVIGCNALYTAVEAQRGKREDSKGGERQSNTKGETSDQGPRSISQISTS